MKNVRIYRFRNIEKGLDLLETRQFYLASPNEFNDPFDNYIQMLDLTFSAKQIEGLVNAAANGTLLGNRAHRKKMSKHYKKRPETVKEMAEKTFQNVFYGTGVCCFSKRIDSILQWSHYADSHKGIALGFDRSLIKANIYEVSYQTEFNKLKYFDDQQEAINKVLSTKSKDWEYEQEVRIINIKSGRYKFVKDALVEVVFGCKTLDKDKELVRQSIN